MKRALNGFSDVTNGLLKFTKSVDYTKSELDKAADERRDKIADLHKDIQHHILRYNITEDGQENLKYIYDNAVKGHEDFTKRTKLAVQKSTKRTLPLVRDQINSMLKKDFGKNFFEMAEDMHGHAVDGYKRSGIPHADDVKGETLLRSIKENLQNIMSGNGFDDDDDDDDEENADIAQLPERLTNVKRDIVTMQAYAKKCG